MDDPLPPVQEAQQNGGEAFQDETPPPTFFNDDTRMENSSEIDADGVRGSAYRRSNFSKTVWGPFTATTKPKAQFSSEDIADEVGDDSNNSSVVDVAEETEKKAVIEIIVIIITIIITIIFYVISLYYMLEIKVFMNYLTSVFIVNDALISYV